MSNVISELLQVSMNHIHDMIDANTIIGTPLYQEGVTIIPVSKVHLGFVSGGSDIKNIKDTPLFGGGTGGGVSLVPVAFLVVKCNEVSLLSVSDDTHLAEKIIDLIPKTVEKAKTLFKNNANIEKI